MITMGKYCKAYPIRRLRRYNHWSEHKENTRKENQETNSKEVKINREPTDDDFLYLQENYVVTDGIVKDESIIFDNVTPEWKDFCDNVLEFQVPIQEPVTVSQ